MSTDPRVTLGKTVRDLRLKRGLSQERLGEMADLDRTYISGIERGVRNVSLLNIVQLARALRSTPSQILKGIR